MLKVIIFGGGIMYLYSRLCYLPMPSQIQERNNAYTCQSNNPLHYFFQLGPNIDFNHSFLPLLNLYVVK